MERVYVERKCYDVYEYVGACPKCGRAQRNRVAQYVDVVCSSCVYDSIETQLIKSISNDDHYIGNIVIDFKNYGSRFRITIMDKDLKLHAIHGHYFNEQDVPLNSIYTEDAVPVIEKCEDAHWLIKIFKRCVRW